MVVHAQAEEHIKRLACFFGACAGSFSFLERDHGFDRVGGLAARIRDRTVITPFDPQRARGEHHDALVLYEKDNVTFEISYTRDHRLDSYIMFNRAHRFPFYDFIASARKAFLYRRDSVVIEDRETVESEIEKLAEVARKHKDLLADCSPRLLERALMIRETVMEQKIRAQYKRELKRVSEAAAKAFMEKNYLLVIELCTPYEHHLSASCLKKLDIARSKILNQLH